MSSSGLGTRIRLRVLGFGVQRKYFGTTLCGKETGGRGLQPGFRIQGSRFRNDGL